MSASEQQYEHPIARLKWLNENQANESWLHEQIDGSWVTLNCGEVYERALRVAAALHSQGLQHGDKVAILAKNSAQWMISDFALMLGGMISVPIYATAGQKTISYVLEHSGAKAIFVGKLDNTAAAEEALQDAVVIAYPESNIDSTFVKHTWNDLLAHEPLSDIANPGKEDIATLVYTSGSTGNPKGVVLTHANILANIEQIDEHVMLEKGDKLFVPALNPVVSIVGEVQFASNHTFNPNLTVEDYIAAAGGTKRQADTGRIYIVKSNGSVELPNNSFWFSRHSDPLEPGDTIIVPINTDYLDGLSTLSTATQILYQIGVAWSAVKN